jgi:hypothetical protein
MEGNVIGLLWRHQYLFEVYDDLQEKNFITYDGRFYFTLISKMREAGYASIDEISIATFMNDKPSLKQTFENKGGFRSINSLAMLLDEINMPKYYDDLLKYDLLMGLHDRGFNVIQGMDKFKLMDSSDVYSYYDGLLNDLFIKKTLDLETADLTKGYADYIQRANSGQNMGISYRKASPIMNFQTCGVRKGCTIVGATTSGGKSSWLAHHYILDFIKSKASST